MCLFIFIIFEIVDSEHQLKLITLQPFTLRTQLNVKDTEKKNHFMIVKMSKDGKSVGIIVKKRASNQNRKPKESTQYQDEVPEIIGIRVPDDEQDVNVYRNAKIVNNKLLVSKK